MVTDSDTWLLGGALLLQLISTVTDLWGVRRRRAASQTETPEFLASWMSRRDPNKLRPYPDSFGNTAESIRSAFEWATVGQWTFGISATAFWTLLGAFVLANAPLLPIPLFALAGGAFVGAMVYRHYARFLTHKKRKYILAHVGVWVGFPLKNKEGIEVPDEPADPTVRKLVHHQRRLTRRPPR